ncbi:right-handed parallel beta-helix repeat-containing protein [Herbiconiux sp. 11R-BC]|uniref:hypothetical protein n=1 Tax=Herbiconiux sp. 11R-BC TaxID=3111637 RepID=UPI003C0AD9BE
MKHSPQNRRRRWLAMLGTAALLAAAPVALVSAPASAASTTYYVDASAGSDSGAGTSTTTAWKTLAKVSATTFGAGDRILFKSGQSWSGQLHPLGSGSSGNPITIGSYGTGAKPVIDGGALTGGFGTGAAVYLNNQSWWTISGLDVKNDSGTDNFGQLDSSTWGLHRDGILVNNAGGNTLQGITISGNTVHDVNGCFNCQGYDGHLNGGIAVIAQNTNDSYAGVSIVDNTVSNVGRGGIVFWDNSYYSTDQTVLTQSKLSTGVAVERNTVTDIDSDGILVFGTDGAMLQRNLVGDAGQRTITGSTTAASAGLWPTRAMNTTVQYNEVYGTQTHDTDGQGFDVDLLSVNTVVQYNYSHDNEGGFLLMMGGYSSGLVVRENLSVNDAFGGVKGVFTFSYGVPTNTDIYDNTIYIGSGLTSKPLFCDGCDASTTGAWSFRNNIVENHGSGAYTYPAANAVIDYNLFYGNHPASEPADAHKLTTDPQLVSPGSAPTGLTAVTGYKIASTSPAKGSGVVISGNGGKDYWGNPRSATAAPSRGFHEVNTFAAATSLTDNANDWASSSAHTSNMTIDTTGPFSNMGGDTSRFSRSNGSAGSVTWNLAGARTFSATVYEFSANTTQLVFASSPDGVTWTTVTTSFTTPVATTNGWAQTTATPSANLPAGTNYVRATISAPTSWAIEIGAITITT